MNHKNCVTWGEVLIISFAIFVLTIVGNVCYQNGINHQAQEDGESLNKAWSSCNQSLFYFHEPHKKGG